MPQDPIKLEILREKVASLLQKQAIEEGKDFHPRRGFYSRIFLVQKRWRGWGWRPVIDLSRLNQFVLCPHFKMETLNSNKTCSSERRLGNIFGSERCLFPNLGSSQVSAISSLLLRRESVSVPSFNFRAFSKSVCLLSGSQNSPDPNPSPRFSGSRLPGRLVTTFCNRDHVMATQQKASENCPRSGFYTQLGEIKTGSGSENRVPRCTFSSRVCSNRSVTKQDSIVSECFDKAAGSQACHSSTVALHSRSDGIHGQSLTPREGFQGTSSVGTQKEMVSKAGFMGRQDSVRFWFVKAISHWTDREFLMSMPPLHHPALELQLFFTV